MMRNFNYLYNDVFCLLFLIIFILLLLFFVFLLKLKHVQALISCDKTLCCKFIQMLLKILLWKVFCCFSIFISLVLLQITHMLKNYHDYFVKKTVILNVTEIEFESNGHFFNFFFKLNVSVSLFALHETYLGGYRVKIPLITPFYKHTTA